MSISRADVRYIAALSRLRFSADEEERLAGELSRIVGYVEQLRQLDTDGVPPMAHVLDLQNVFRPDQVEVRIAREEALGVAPDADAQYFRVPRVIE